MLRAGLCQTGVCSFAGCSDKRWPGEGGGRRERERERVLGLLLESSATSAVWSPCSRLRELAEDANNEEEKLF